ncbi:MAG: hypothetical protein WKG07_20160 [Hymenobacter sp.]
MCMALQAAAPRKGDWCSAKSRPGAERLGAASRKMAYSMVTSVCGMNAEARQRVSFYDSKGQNECGFSKPYSEATSQVIERRSAHHHRPAPTPAPRSCSPSAATSWRWWPRSCWRRKCCCKTDLERASGGQASFRRPDQLPGPHGRYRPAAKPPAS